jgi:hypothetical protein
MMGEFIPGVLWKEILEVWVLYAIAGAVCGLVWGILFYLAYWLEEQFDD